MPRPEYAILGAGALGSIIGAHLARAGHEVVLLARGRRAAQVSDEGLRITGIVEFTVPVRVITDPQAFTCADAFIVATKAIATAQALAPYRHADVGTALSIQNGLMKNELLADAFGADKVLGAMANSSGELLPSGEVLFTRNVRVLVGEPDGSLSPRALRIAGDIDAAGVRTAATRDIGAQEWTKFAIWLGLMVPSVFTRRNSWQYLCDPGAALVIVRVVREVGRLAEASGFQVAGDAAFPVGEMCRMSDPEAVAVVTGIGRHFETHAPAHRVSALQDLEAGRRLEVDETVGHAVRMAQRLGLELPLLDSFYHLISAIDRTQPSAEM